jgi:hypothetical protein
MRFREVRVIALSSDRRARHSQNNAARVAGLGRIFIEVRKVFAPIAGSMTTRICGYRLIFAFHSPILRLDTWVLEFTFATQLDSQKNQVCSWFSEVFTSLAWVVSRSRS